jgi:hypothetical protein
MSENSPIPPQSSTDHLSCLDVLTQWLSARGGETRYSRVLSVLAEMSAQELRRDGTTSPVDVDTLRAIYVEQFGGVLQGDSPGRWLRREKFVAWWMAHRGEILADCANAGLACGPDLRAMPSAGGRGNLTRYQLAFVAMDVSEKGTDPDTDVIENAGDRGSRESLTYRIEPVMAAWWLRGVFVSQGFAMRSWRGVCLLLLLTAPVLITLFILAGFVVSPSTLTRHPALTITGLLGSILWLISTWPMYSLPTRRLVIAPQWVLSLNAPYGVLRFIRGEVGQPLAGGWVHLEGPQATCPICAGRVILDEGGTAFPDRIIGRCEDSPLEHVFSYDPVFRSGAPLR